MYFKKLVRQRSQFRPFTPCPPESARALSPHKQREEGVSLIGGFCDTAAKIPLCFSPSNSGSASSTRCSCVEERVGVGGIRWSGYSVISLKYINRADTLSEA